MSWPYAYTHYVWPMLALAALGIVLGVYAWRRRQVPAATPFGLIMLCSVIWSLSAAQEFAAVDSGTKFFWFQIAAVIKLPLVTCSLLFVLAYAGLDKWLTRTVLAILSLPCVIVALLMVTNPVHHQFWSSVSFGEHIGVAYGPLFWATGIYSVILLLLQLSVLMWLWFRAPLLRWPIALMVGAVVIARIAFVAEAAGYNAVAPLDAGLLFSGLVGVAYFIGLFRFHLFDVIPVGREIAIEQMVDGMMILDTENRIVDPNRAIAKMLGVSQRSMIGQPAAEALSAFPDFLHLLGQKTEARVEISLAGANGDKRLQALVSPLTHPGGFHLGRLVLLQDVTEQQRARERLEQQERSLAALQERERLARELHDGLSQTLAAAHLQASVASRLLARGDGARAKECLDRLAEMMLEAEADVRDYLLGAKVVLSSGLPFFPTLREYFARFGRQYDLNIEMIVPEELEEKGLEPAVELQVMRIIQEALSNVRKHSHAHHACVSFAVAGEQVQIVISDDGCGFDAMAVASTATGFGLSSMRGRAEAVGGCLVVTSCPSQGTQITVLVPGRH